MSADARSIILIDPNGPARELTQRRLRAQGYSVEATDDPAAGAAMALRTPPAALVADLWMPTISGVQLCRLLRSEPATADVPVLLCGDEDEPRNRFWAERAGASAFVARHRTGDLVRALAKAIAAAPVGDGFFFQLDEVGSDVRDRIARHLDEALFDSVIASEVRALAACGEFERLFDLFAQLVSQLCRYRWLAVWTVHPRRLAVHCSPSAAESVEGEARAALAIDVSGEAVEVLRIEDEDAVTASCSIVAVVREITLGTTVIGSIALSPCATGDGESAERLVPLLARELGGPLRMAALVEESQRLASTDALTKISNRRAFSEAMVREVARAQRHGYSLCVLLLDIDHFKKINDGFGHASGDRVLAAVGALLGGSLLRQTDLRARWGGEEFVVAYLSTGLSGAIVAAERMRQAIEALDVRHESGERITVTASVGVAEMAARDSLDSLVARADEAMYEAKSAGRNRVCPARSELAAQTPLAIPMRQSDDPPAVDAE